MSARKGRRPARARKLWTDAEDSVLRIEWGEVGQRAMRAKLPGRSWNAIYQRAYGLGLPMGIPQGFVSLMRAAEALGIKGPPDVRRLAFRQGVTIRLHPRPRSTAGSSLAPWRCVDLDEITAALHREMTTTEVVTPAAHARNVDPSTLRQWLRTAGELPVWDAASAGKNVRVLSEVVDRVVAEHRAPGYGKRAAVAQELGVSSKTLKTLLKRAGVATVHRNDGGIPIEAARRVVAEHRGQVAA